LFVFFALQSSNSDEHESESELHLQHDAGAKDRDEENRLTESEKNKALQKQLEVCGVFELLSIKKVVGRFFC